jgi:NtrC-family two-component system sensor histidine kinase KinB
LNLRSKLVAAQAPLAIALLAVGVVSGVVTTHLGGQAQLILSDNYRSVLAIQRMKDALERLEGWTVLVLRGHAETAEPGDAARAGIKRERDVFEGELTIQEGNLTEAGEPEVTQHLRAAWNQYVAALAAYQALPGATERDRAFFADLVPSHTKIKVLADEILAINQDAMVRKSEHVDRRAHLFERVVIAAVMLALLLGIVASTWLTTRMLRPLAVVSAAVRRFGEGDLVARAVVQGNDEIAAVAAEFNNMAARLERYRASSLGELLQAQQAAQAAIDGLADPVLLLDAKGQLQGANRAAADVLAVDPERPSGDPWAGADPSVRAAVDRLRGHVLGGKGAYVPRGFEEALRIGNAPGGERIFLPRATPIYGENGAVAGAALVFQDATRLFRFDELKNNLVATVAHEFRTPLTSLRMALHLCTEQVAGPLTEKQGDLLFAAREDCERLQIIVDDLLNLSRIEAGHIDLHRRRSEPGTLVAQTVEVHRAAAAQAEVKIVTEVPAGLPEVFVDPERLELVFSNLINNAIRYAPKGSEILLRVRPRTSGAVADEHRLAAATEVRFEIVDQGPGIAPQHQAGLFEKFFRVPGSPEGGSGLGLFIAKGLVQAHGGNIGVDSVVGEGTTFWFTVPVAPELSAPSS